MSGLESQPRPGPPPLPEGFELRGVSKTYGHGPAQVQALVDIDLRIEPGQFVAMMGPSGSGKSTCMNLLGCLDSPTAGGYFFHGVDVSQLDPDQLAMLRRHYIGFVFQGFNLLARASALDNVELPLHYHRVSAEERRVRAQAALVRVGLAGREHHTPAELSGGQQQRVAIARALITEPTLLLADEPTGNLDTERSLEILQLLVRLNRETGLTVAMVTHEPDLAHFAERIVRFRDGRIVEDRAAAAA